MFDLVQIGLLCRQCARPLQHHWRQLSQAADVRTLIAIAMLLDICDNCPAAALQLVQGKVCNPHLKCSVFPASSHDSNHQGSGAAEVLI